MQWKRDSGIFTFVSENTEEQIRNYINSQKER